jgi:hypothetical protein
METSLPEDLITVRAVDNVISFASSIAILTAPPRGVRAGHPELVSAYGAWSAGSCKKWRCFPPTVDRHAVAKRSLRRANRS